MDDILNKSSIDYEYKIDPAAPTPSTNNIESNETATPLAIGELGMVKSVNKTYATIGDILTYTVVLTNTGNLLLSDIVFKDIIPSGGTFMTGSVTVNGTSQPTYNPNTGFNLGSLLILGSITVTFQAEVTSLPNPNTIINQATSTFNYLVIVPISGSSSSNTVTTTINVTTLTLVKSASPEMVKSGDTLTYTTIITNTGNINATNIEFIDTVASELTFVTGSVTIDGTPEPTYDPNSGFNLGTLAPAATITVVFETTVN